MGPVSFSKSSADRINRFSRIFSVRDKLLHKEAVQGFQKFRSFYSDGLRFLNICSRFDISGHGLHFMNVASILILGVIEA